jgi:hypothetical protein
MTAFNPPSSIFFNGVTFNPNIIEQGNTVVSSGGIGDVTLAGNNNFTGANSFTGGSINVPTQSSGNNTTLAASTAYVDSAISTVSGVSLTADNTFTGINSFTNASGIITPSVNGIAGAGSSLDLGNTTDFITIGNSTSDTTIKNTASVDQNLYIGTSLYTSNIEGNGSGIVIDNSSLGTTFNGQVFANNSIFTNEIDSSYLVPTNLYIGQNSATAVVIGTDVIPVVIGIGAARPYLSNIETVNMIAESIDLPITGYISSPNITNPSSALIVGDATTGVNLVGPVNATTPTTGNNSTLVATTAFVQNTITGSGAVTLAGNNNFTGANSFTGGSITMTTQAAGNNTTFGATTAFVSAAITALKAAANTWSGANDFTSGSIRIITQATGNNTTLGANTAFVNNAITAYRTGNNTISGNNNFTGSNTFSNSSNFTGTINVTTQTAGNNTTLAASTAFVSAADSASTTALKAAANTWSGANDFTTGSINVKTQIAGNSTILAASTEFVGVAISALSSIYQTAAQVSSAISTALTNFLGTANTWTADQDLHLVNVLVKNQTQGTGNTTAASTFYTDLAVTNGISTGYSNITTGTNNWTGVNTFTANTFVPTQTAGNNTTLAASTAFVNAAITALKAASNTWSGTNDFTSGSINVTTQTAGNSTTLAASTAFVTSAISALSSIYQTAAQVTTSINSALTTFKGTANTFTANQIFPTIQFSTGTLNQAFFIQYVNNYAFGGITANSSVTTTISYATLGMTNFTTLITATISNASASANGSRVLFTIQTQSATSFTIVGFNVTATNTSACAFSLVAYGR